MLHNTMKKKVFLEFFIKFLHEIFLKKKKLITKSIVKIENLPVDKRTHSIT